MWASALFAMAINQLQLLPAIRNKQGDMLALVFFGLFQGFLIEEDETKAQTCGRLEG